ncbi:hypothetical protein LCGC14_2578130 [marine sediment metagenome]|uniref:Uncharacterized protein n=1 Tax=marine sediment metagenome TaxID=412755 RepID=A0A0F9CRF5_9ZZZZ
MTLTTRGTYELTVKIPGKPSDLIKLAVDDMIAIERRTRYRIVMCDWHCPEGDAGAGTDVCEVCFAGSIMARRTKEAGHRTCLTNSSFSADDSNKFIALDSFRRGDIRDGLRRIVPREFYVKGEGGVWIDSVMLKTFGNDHWNWGDFVYASYNNDRRQFIRCMRFLIRKFKAAGY